MKKNSIPIMLLLWLPLTIGGAALQSGYDLFQKALMLERADGKLQEAIALYQKVVNESQDESLAAKAQLQIGVCYEKLGQTEARAAYQKVIETYPKQTESVSLARECLALLSKGDTAQDTDLKIRKVLEGEGVGMDFYGSVSPDGRYISGFDTENGWNPAIRDMVTGKSRCLTEHKGGYNYESRWSPDGKKLVYDWWYYSDPEKSELRVIGADGSGEKAIWTGKGTYIHTYAWSPDGTKILAQITQPEKMDLCLISVKDGSIQVLKSYPGSRQAIPIWLGCVFSPDGRSIAYAREPIPEQSRHWDIYLLSLDNKEETPLITHPANEYVLGWSRDGKHVLFASDRTGSIGIWSVQVAGGTSSRTIRLIKNNVGPIIPLGVTKDNSLFYGYLPRARDIYLAEMDPASGRVISKPRKLDLPFEGHNGDPAYSPDGKHLAYVSDRGVPRIISNRILGIHDFSSGEDKEFDPNLITFGEPRWSPNGRSIYAMGCVKPWEDALYQLDAETGSRSTVIAPEKKTDVFAHGRSPDGKSIYYLEASDTQKPGILDNRVIELNPATGLKKEIYRFTSVNSTGGLFAVAPDGKNLAFVQRPDDPSADILYSVPATGGSAKALVKNLNLSLMYLVWSPDSKFVVFTAWDKIEKKCELMRVPAGGGELQKLGLDSQAYGRTNAYANRNEGIGAFSIRPDGLEIAFDSGEESRSLPEIWVMFNLRTQ